MKTSLRLAAPMPRCSAGVVLSSQRATASESVVRSSTCSPWMTACLMLPAAGQSARR